MSDRPMSSENSDSEAGITPPPIFSTFEPVKAPTLGPPPGPALRPVKEEDRIITMDVLRGFALFGIIFVNIVWFSQTYFDATDWEAPRSASDDACGLLVHALFGSKFLMLFSLLFGMGLAIQSRRAMAAGSAYVLKYVRRLFVLLLIGLAHAFLLWWGDILSAYAVAGFGLLAVHRLKAKTLIILACLCFVAQTMCIGGTMALNWIMAQQQEAYAEGSAGLEDGGYSYSEDPYYAWEPVEDGSSDEPRWRQLLDECGYYPWGPEFAEAERIAYGEGPIEAAITVRGCLYLAHTVYYKISAGSMWRFLSMFLLGAALVKLGLFDENGRRLRSTLYKIGLGIGLPCEVAYALYVVYLYSSEIPQVVSAGLGQIHSVLALLLALGYIGAISMIIDSGRAACVTKALAATGRMALTNYIGHSVLASAIFYWWGFGLFESVSRPIQLLLACTIFIAQVGFSMVWIRFFRFGPLEWIWRTLTYFRLQPMRRDSRTVSVRR